jgi:outer membrane protein OmpA-like peptidoglycan-associated protein
MMSLSRASLLALAALSVAPTAGCRKKVEPVDTDTDVVAPPTVALQVVSIDPGTATAGEAFEAEVIGSGFENGARVSFAGAAATSTGRIDENTLAVSVPGLAQGLYDVTVTNPDGTKATLRDGLEVVATADPLPPPCEGGRVAFGFDKYDLDGAARGTLDRLAGCLVAQGTSLVIEGHCDARGPTEYNVALGNKRADAVQRYLLGKGVPPGRLRTVSYGEERPLREGDDESAWASNRRAELVVEGRR